MFLEQTVVININECSNFDVPIFSLLDVNVAAVNMNWTLNFISKNIKSISGEYICITNVHSIVMSVENKNYQTIQNSSLLSLPDGGPLSYLGRKKGFSIMDRVTGPDLMDQIFKISAEKGYSHFFYGSTEETLVKLHHNLITGYPNINILGTYSPPFFNEIVVEDKKILDRINNLGADFIWVGLGAPKQEQWMALHRGKIKGLMIGVGAGFDYFAGNILRAPKWMQRNSLEWLFRLIQNPRRLFLRYTITNTKFIIYILKNILWNILYNKSEKT